MSCHGKGCPALPFGGKVCHCGACHETFVSLALFDRHQETDYRRSSGVSCRHPGDMGMVQAPNLVWWTPDALRSSTEKLAKANMARRAA